MDLLEQRDKLSATLADSPYDLIVYYQRATIYDDLQYPDLAAGDANKALLLTSEVLEDGSEYHEQTVATLRPRCSNDVSVQIAGQNGSAGLKNENHQSVALCYAEKCFVLLSRCLQQCGCHRSALQFCERGLQKFPDNASLIAIKSTLRTLHEDSSLSGSLFSHADLPEQGHVRREVYPWSTFEPDRFTSDSLRALNEQLLDIAPKCEIRTSSLPCLTSSAAQGSEPDRLQMSFMTQLGMFAKESISPDEVFLEETSCLTASNRPLEPFCDGCRASLPSLSDQDSTAVACPDCDDVYFCSETCRGNAEDLYHTALCGMDIDMLSSKSVSEKYSQATLYSHLLLRALSMSVTQTKHPLELQDVRFLWGDFSTATASTDSKLPFTFENNIAAPLAMLEKMDINIFDPPVPGLSETWVTNILYAKFYGTASAFLSPVSRKPEMSGVHPMWCLANHSCDPNAAWDWKGGAIKFWARRQEERAPGATGEAGIKAGEEIRSNYCDIFMDVKQRREWASSSLGGMCMCERCIREEKDGPVNKDG